ncbi:MAG: Hsp70 family protein [Sandaracinaceae bacterium]|nr:Hsp70 family protein [Sandaracinaceae bacterium]
MATLGIDLGTTHTVVAHNGRASVVAPDEPRPTLLPSALAYPPSRQELVGWEAKRRRPIDPVNTLLSTKRLIGARSGSYRAQRFAEHHPYEIVDHHGVAAFQTRCGVVTPVEAATRLLCTATMWSGCMTATRKAVITVPASFEQEERQATMEAARESGFAGAALIEEPVATAISYLDRSNVRYAVVYDLGGGTFDLALVDCSRYPFRVVAHAGDPYLGGDDVDRILAQRVAERVLAEHRWDLAADPVTFARLTAACETAKVALATQDRVLVELAEIDPAGPWTSQPTALAQHDLVGITQDLVRRTFSLVDHVLSDAGVRTKDVDAIFMAGGSTSLPGLRETVGQYFSKRARFDLDPMHVVAVGASLAAARPDLAGLLDAEGFAA